MSDAASAGKGERRIYRDPALEGRRVQADGGSEAIDRAHGGKIAHASRDMFEGVLTGRRMDDGDPPWRWLEIGQLTDKPSGFADQTVWCEESYVYFLDD